MIKVKELWHDPSSVNPSSERIVELLLRPPHTWRFFCRRAAELLSDKNQLKIGRATALPHSGRFYVATYCAKAWGRLIQKIATSLSSFSGFHFSKKSVQSPPCWKDACSRDSYNTSWLVAARARPDKKNLAHRTLADKARQNLLRSSTVRCRPTSLALVADFYEYTAH